MKTEEKMLGKIFIASFVCVGLLVLYGCNLPNEDETYSLGQAQLVDFSGAYWVELSPEPGFNSFTLFHTGNKVIIYDNLGRTWKGDASGISESEAGARPTVTGEGDQEEARYMHTWQMQFSIETVDTATGRRAVIAGVGLYSDIEVTDPYTGWESGGSSVEINGQYWTNYGPKGAMSAMAFTIEERLPTGTETTQ